MKVLCTGSSGFIGGYVQEELLSKGHTPIAFDRHDKGFRPDRSELFLGDITNEVDVTEAVAHADAWIHLAGVLGTAETVRNPKAAATTNILGGLNVFNAAAQYKVPGVNIAVGNYFMNNTYSITKSTMERFADMYNVNNGTEITITRALNAYGPRQISASPWGPSKVRKIMPAFVNQALDNEAIMIYGDGTQVMDMVYVGDVAKVLVSALEYTVENGAIKHVLEAGSGNATTVNEIADEVLEKSWSTAGVKHVPMRIGEPDHSVVLGDPDTLHVLGLSRTDLKPLDEGVAETVEYFKRLRA